MPPPPLELMEELIEEILLRLPPSDPASLVRAALVSTPWCRIVSGAAFRRRFRAFHRTAPLLGFLCDPWVYGFRWDGVLVPTSSAFRPREPFAWRRPLDARHGRVLFHDSSSYYHLHVWNPITDAWIALPMMPNDDPDRDDWTAAVLCAAAATGECDHLDCHDGPFTVVIVGSGEDDEEMFSYVYSSESGQWSEQTYADYCPDDSLNCQHSMLMGNALYFMFGSSSMILKYDLGTREMTMMDLPRYDGNDYDASSVSSVQLMTTEGGRRLGFVRLEDTRLCLWSRDDEADVGWAPNRVIELEKLLPFDRSLAWRTFLLGFAEGVGVIFLCVGDGVFTVDLKSSKVMKVYEGRISSVVPYMSFRTPALRSASTDARP
ncbi:hypothetical protein SEVIR_2G014000v4 [Setaria viridis]|uniref:Uncharacterized protein n=1 Tax=Setaria viridis TaxID=4556 RepID=A0A4U6VKC2_SETVI|nr:uncharacterized protein LOC117842608 [Setaria viridis]TKW30120.1 hypothetical protein SEVIR_2G014000v2 [Setaria viridis]